MSTAPGTKVKMVVSPRITEEVRLIEFRTYTGPLAPKPVPGALALVEWRGAYCEVIRGRIIEPKKDLAVV